jgi:GDP-L-fucose synthase
VWGTGSPRREFLHVDDLADACLFLMDAYEGEGFVNVGVGEDLTIRDLVELVRGVVGYEGEVVWDTSKPDGTPRKLVDVTRLHGLGWKAKIPLEEGVRATYEWFLEHQGDFRG